MPAIKKSLNSLGFTTPTEIQAKVIPLLLENPKSDVHAQAQTGTGKTLAFGIPLLQAIDPSKKAVQGLVIAPTRELVLQIYESLKDVSRESGIIIEPIYGGMSIDRQVASIKRGAQIIIGTPGRLNDHLRRKTLVLNSLKILVLDEADIMLDMGFKEEIDIILNQAPKDRQIWLFSATVGAGIKQLIISHMQNVLTVKAEKKGVVSTQVQQYYCVVPMRERIDAIARFIEAAPNFYGIIFCQTKVLTNEVMEILLAKGFKVNSLHGDMKQSLRNQVIKGFKHQDFNILVATDVAARGIDVSNLTHVINFTVPREHESYIHRIGRTGRAGKEGIAITFIAPSEFSRIRRLQAAAHTTLQEIAVPTLETIIGTKMGAVSDFIEQAKKPDRKLTKVHKAIQELTTTFSQDEIHSALILALEEKFFKDVIHEDMSKVKAHGAVSPQEICMELGRDDGFSEDEVRNYLLLTCGLQPQELHKVRVLNKKSFISIPESRLQDCLKAMREKPLAKIRHKIYLVEDKPRDRDERRSGQRKETDRFDKRREGGKRHDKDSSKKRHRGQGRRR
jgi:ATP-dependent RNA helicase DeaD